jgi:hypothetical protein
MGIVAQVEFTVRLFARGLRTARTEYRRCGGSARIGCAIIAYIMQNMHMMTTFDRASVAVNSGPALLGVKLA